MLSASDFINSWMQSRVPEKLIRCPTKIVNLLNLDIENRAFLSKAGLPNDAAPFIGFSSIDSCEPLSTSTGEEEHKSCRLIGSDGAGNFICFDDDVLNSIFLIDHEGKYKRSLFNSSVIQLAECLLAYRQFHQKSREENGELVFDKNIFPDSQLKWFEAEIKRIDAAAFKKGCFWRQAFIDASTPW